VTGQTDIYTLGIVMYEMIAGTRPFPESTTAGAGLAAMLKTTPEPLYLRAPIPRPLDEIVMRCLERETSKRYRSVGALREDLERIGIDGLPANSTTVRVGNELVDENDETAITPPPESTVETPRKAVRSKPALSEWTDDDEHAPTSTRLPDGTDMAHEPTRQVVAPQRATPRPILQRAEPPVGLAAAPFSTPRVRPPTAQVTHDPQSEALGVAQTALQLPSVGAQLLGNPSSVAGNPLAGHARGPLGQPPPQGLPPGVPSPFQGSGVVASPMTTSPSGRATTAVGPHGAGSPVPTPTPGQPNSGRVRSPTVPPLGAGRPKSPTVPPLAPNTPGSLTTTAPGYLPVRHGPQAPAAPMHGAGPRGAPPPLGANLPATPIPGYGPPALNAQPPVRPPTAGYDMGTHSARDLLVRRLVWIVVLLVAAGIGFVVASQL
jgi:hypothetical protein